MVQRRVTRCRKHVACRSWEESKIQADVELNICSRWCKRGRVTEEADKLDGMEKSDLQLAFHEITSF